MVSSNNAIYNTIGASISGVTNTLTVTNPSNTASSAARETIVVGGGSAGDPTINWNVSGVTNWEMGIDNSVSDNLTISQGTALGTNDVWRMDTSGRRLMPLQPLFVASRTASILNATGDGTLLSPVIWDSVQINQGNYYNNATGIFTAPVTGNYLFGVRLSWTNLTLAHTEQAIAITTSGSDNIFSQLSPGTVKDSSNTAGFSGCQLVRMTANDTAIVKCSVGGSTKTVTFRGGNLNINSFWGMLLC